MYKTVKSDFDFFSNFLSLRQRETSLINIPFYRWIFVFPRGKILINNGKSNVD